MLVLSRKKGERIFIGKDVTITVVDIERGRVRIGIEAPRTIPVMRSELVPADDTSTKSFGQIQHS